MSLTPKLKSLIYGSGIIATTLLTGCGGGGGGDEGGSKTPEPPANVAPTLSIESADRATEHDTVVLNAVADDLDGSIASYQWSASHAGVVFDDAKSATVSFIAPDVDVDTDFTISLTVTDDDGASVSKDVNFTVERIFKTLMIAGKVGAGSNTINPDGTEEPLIVNSIGYATISVTVGDETIEFIGTGEDSSDNNKGTDSVGNYFIEFDVDERNFDSLVKLTVTGNENYDPGVQLVSLLKSFNSLSALSGSDSILEAHEDIGVNVTAISTSQYVITKAKNSGNEITEESLLLALYKSNSFFVSSDVRELAKLLKIVIDDANVNLPSGITNTLQLIESELAADEVIDYINNNPQLLPANFATSSEYFEHILDNLYGDKLSLQFIDTDRDGITNNVDTDDDGDNVPDDRDFFPLDPNLYAQTIGMLEYKDYLPDELNATGNVRSCVNAAWFVNDLPNLPEYNDVSVLDVKYLYCIGSGLIEIEELKPFENLEELSLINTGVTDISVIANFSKLRVLDITGLKITDFSALENLTNLETLILNDTGFADLTLLTKLTKLKRLELKSGVVAELSEIINFTELEVLNLENNKIVDASALGSLTKLTELYLANNNIEQLPDTNLLPLLTTISLHNNAIGNVDNLSGLTSVTELNLSNNNISDFSELASLTQLTLLNLGNPLPAPASQNAVTNLPDLSLLTMLTDLNLSKNALTDLTNLNALTALVNLNISNNTTITTVADLTALVKLENLSGNHNSITNLDVLSGFTALVTVDFSNNQVASTPNVAGLTNLTTLLLNDNKIADITSLVNLNILPQFITLTGNEPLVCADLQALVAKATSQESTLTVDQDGDCIAKDVLAFRELSNSKLEAAYQTNFDAKPTSKLYAQLTSDTYDLDSRVGEVISCWQPSADVSNGYPICFPRVTIYGDAEPICNAQEGDVQMTCTSSSLDYSYEFTLDADYGPALDKRHKTDFNDRLLFTLFGSTVQDKSVKPWVEAIQCSALVAGESTCTYNHPEYLVDVDAVKWKQKHDVPLPPRCEGVKGETIVQCSPRGITPGELPFTETDESLKFSFDLSTLTLIPPVAEEEEECDPEISVCTP